MTRVEDFLQAAERPNTLRSYASAVRHFEEEWRGLLPATSKTIARYLADYATTLSSNTLRQRLSALSRWHTDQGFPDPTKAALVRQVLKGIRALHPVTQTQARPLELLQLQQVDAWLERAIALAQAQANTAAQLRHTRDRALVLLGFWRGFRSDELVRLRFEHITLNPGVGLSCYLGQTKGDRQNLGTQYSCPALSRLCAVAAMAAWMQLLAQETLSATASGASVESVTGPVFRKIDQWGRVSEAGLHPNSLIPILRRLFGAAGLSAAQDYSSHSLRRGFAGWARASGWDIKELMAYIGWKDIKSAMRYLDGGGQDIQARFEKGLTSLAADPALSHIQLTTPRPVDTAAETTAEKTTAEKTAEATVEAIVLRIKLLLSPHSKGTRSQTKALRLIEKACLERYAMQRLGKKKPPKANLEDASQGTEYELRIQPNMLPKDLSAPEALDDAIYALIDDMYRVADDNHCMLEASVFEPATGKHWN